jgi:hypothetical protein
MCLHLLKLDYIIFFAAGWTFASALQSVESVYSSTVERTPGSSALGWNPAVPLGQGETGYSALQKAGLRITFFSTLQTRSDLCIPRNETARRRSQFLHS